MEEPKFIITRKPTKEDFIQFNRVISDKEFHFKRSVTIVSIVIFVIWTDVLLSIHLQSKVLTAALFLLNILMNVAFGYMAIILFLSTLFIFPTQERCEQEYNTIIQS